MIVNHRMTHYWPLSVLGLFASTFAVAQTPTIDSQVLQAEKARIQAIAKAIPPTVSVFGAGDSNGGGSGVVITSDGYALTNFHVTKPVGDYLRCSMPDGELYDAVIVGIDPTGDVAMIKLLGRDDFPAAELGDSDELEVGQWCFAVGNPFLLATDFQPTVTFGIVSGVHRYQYPAGTLLEYADCIQTDAAINPGNSGGPLFNSKGQLVGINGRGSFEKRGRVNVGVGYAISINQIKHFMGYLRSGRIVDHATLGASLATDEDGKVIVSNILDSSDAYRRGLRYGDEVTHFGGRAIRSVNEFKNVLGIFPRGWRVPIRFRQDGEAVETLVRLAGVHSQEELLRKVQSAPVPENPGPKPNDEDEKKKPNEDEPRPRPRLPLQLIKKKPQKIPEEVAKLIEARRGFSNYHFNRLNRQRVWDNLITNGAFTEFSGDWHLDGELDSGAAIQITLAETTAKLQLGEDEFQIVESKSLDRQLDPVGSGGLLLALHQWRRLLAVGVQRYGDVYFLGTAPIDNTGKHFDVLVATYDVIESRYYFDPDTGLLTMMEMYPESETDPCEVYFREYHEVEGRQVPQLLDVRFGNNEFGSAVIKSISMAKQENPS